MPDRRLERHAVVTVPALLTLTHAAELLDCSPRTVRRWIADGTLPGVIEHGRLMVRADELRAHIEALDRPGPSAPRRRRKPRNGGRFGFLDGEPATLAPASKAPSHRGNGRGHGP